MRKSSWLFFAFVTMTVFLAVIAGVSKMDMPKEARFKRLDAQRMNDLRGLAYSISEFRKKTQKLPTSLDELARSQGLGRVKLRDQENKLYVYRVKGDATYELCAHFDLASDDDRRANSQISAAHPAGDYCFTITAGP